MSNFGHKGFYRLLKLNRVVRSHRLKFAGILAARLLHLRHLSIRLDPLVGCNLGCLMCPFTARRDSGPVSRDSFSGEDLERLAQMLLPRALQLVVGCSYEPTLYRGFLKILELGRKYSVPFMGLTTNGQLLKREHMDCFGEVGLDEITISIHGVSSATYEELMVGASHERLLKSLAMIAQARCDGTCPNLKLRLNYTVCRQNLRELPFFLETYGEFLPDVLQIRPFYGDQFVEGRLDTTDLATYRKSIDEMVVDCRRRGILLLANREDPRFRKKNYNVIVMPAIYLYVDPTQVWRKDFDWRQETYAEYCHRTGFTRQLLAGVFSGREGMLRKAGRYADSAGYDSFD